MGRNIHMGGAKVGPCPSCGGVGTVPDGTYDLIDNTLRAVRAADIGKGTLNSIIELLESRTHGKTTDQDVIAGVKAVAPAFAPTVKDYLAKSDPASWLALLVAILMMLQSATAPSPPTAQEIAEAIWAKDHSAQMGRERSASSDSTP